MDDLYKYRDIGPMPWEEVFGLKVEDDGTTTMTISDADGVYIRLYMTAGNLDYTIQQLVNAREEALLIKGKSKGD